MKAKIFSLSVLSILALVILISGVSAVTLADWDLTTDGVATSVDTNVNASDLGVGSTISGLIFDPTDGATASGWNQGALGPNDYYEVTLTIVSGFNAIINLISFDHISNDSTTSMSFDVKWSKDNFVSSTNIVSGEASTTTSSPYSSTNTNIALSGGETFYLRIFGYNADAGETFSIKNLNIDGTVTAIPTNQPDEITSCSATGDSNGDLDIKIKDINVMKGFGDDDKFWYPLDEIEVEIEVENNGDEDIDDIVVEWGLYDVDADDWIIDDEENDFNLKDGKDNTMYINFKLEDVDDFENDDYVFYVWANGEIDDANNTEVCASDSEEIEIVNNDDFVVLDNIEYPATASCGSEIQITADVWNVGDSDQDDVTVVIFNSELGINKIVEIGDINDFDNEILDTFIEIPSDMEEKTYAISLKVFDDDHDVYKTDEDNDESKYFIRITLENCFVSSPALVSANLESGGKAGEELVVKATITNSGTKSADYTIKAAGYSEWADSVSIDQSVFTLDPASSKEVLFTFSVEQDASGENQFNIEVISGNKLVATQPVQIEIQETISGFAGITGNVFEGKNKYLWGIGILNVILIVFIIIVAIRVAKR